MSLYTDPPTGGTDPVVKSKRTQATEQLIDRSGQFMGDMLNRRYDLKPFDHRQYKFDTDVIMDGDRVMLQGDPDKGKGTVIADVKSRFKFSPEQIARVKKMAFGSGEDRQAAKQFMIEMGILKGNVGSMTDRNMHDVINLLEMNLDDINMNHFFDDFHKHYGQKMEEGADLPELPPMPEDDPDLVF